MSHNLFTFAVIALLFSLISSKDSTSDIMINEIPTNEEREFTILPLVNVLVVSTYVKEDGYIANKLSLPEKYKIEANDIVIYLLNNTSKIDITKVDQDLQKQMSFDNDGSDTYIISFPIKKEHIAYTYFKKLPPGKVKVKAYYVTKGMGVFLIIVIIVGCLLVLAFIFWLIRKILC